MTEATVCPIWGTPAAPIQTGRYGDYVLVNSPRVGGQLKMTGTAVTMSGHLTEAQKVALTDLIMTRRRQGETCPDVGSDVVSRIKDNAIVLPSPTERYNNLLSYLESSASLGSSIKYAGVVNEETFHRKHEMLAHTSSTKDSEVAFLLDQAEEAQHVKKIDLGIVRLSLAGHNHVASLRANLPDSKQAFVAMWFNSTMTPVYEKGIHPAIVDAGYKPLRIDKKEHNNKIDDEIIAEIRRSRFVVADFTSEPDKPRGGVYFEAGFALGLNRPVIWTCRSDIINQIHFDTRQFNHIVWSDAEELRQSLKNRIVAVVGPGPLQPLP